MTNIASLIRAAQQAVTGHTVTDWSDPDLLTDEQLRALAGPGCHECETWDESDALPTSTAGLTLLAGMIEGATESQIRLQLRKTAGPGYPEYERWALTGGIPTTDAGRELIEAVQAAGKKEAP